MNKQERERLIKRAVYARRMETGEYEQIMDEAGSLLDQPEDDQADLAWDNFCAEVDERSKVPLTAREQKRLENRKRREELEQARIMADNSARNYARLLARNR